MTRHIPIVAAASPRQTRQTGGADATFAPNGLCADASKVSPRQFFAAASERFFPTPEPTRLGEKRDASRKFIAAAWASDDVPTLRRAYLRELDAIDARWNEADDDLSLTYVERIAPGRVAL